MKGYVQKAILYFSALCLGLAPVSASPSKAQGRGHKSAAQLERLTPDQLVDEYINEQLRHNADFDDDYPDLLLRYIRKAGVRAVKRLAEVIGSVAPPEALAEHSTEAARFEAAWMLLSDLDLVVVRLRGTEEGRRAIATLQQAMERMRTIEPGSTTTDSDQPRRYQMATTALKQLQGLSFCDDGIRNGLKQRYKVTVSDNEFNDFVNYLISQDPYYPSRSKMRWYRDTTNLNKGEYPRQYYLEENIEPFYKSYLQYKAQKAKL